MKKTICILSVILAGWAVAVEPEMPKAVSLSPGVEVVSADSFLCKAQNDSVLQNARLRVQIRGVEKIADPNTRAAAVSQLKKTFNSAKSIQLRAIQYGVGFRLNADVYIDGQSLVAILAAKGLAGLPKAETLTSVDKTKVYPSTPPKKMSVPVVVSQPKTNKVSMTDLMKRQVDLKAIEPDTTFSDAIDIISNSTDPKLPLIILWGDLKYNTLIDKDTPVGIGGMTRMPLGHALNLVLRSAASGGPQPLLLVDGGVISLGTKETFGKKNSVQIYRVEDLMNPQFPDIESGVMAATGSSGSSQGGAFQSGF